MKMANYNISVFLANKYLFKAYLLSLMMQQDCLTISKLIEKLTLKLMDLSSSLIHNKNTHTDYTIKPIEIKNAEILKKIFILMSKSTEPDEFEETELSNLNTQIKAFHVLAKKAKKCIEHEKPKSYLNGVLSYFHKKLWTRKASKKEDNEEKMEEEEKEEDSIEKLKPFLLKLIESISSDLTRQLNIVDYSYNNDLNFEDPKRISQHLYNRILRIEEVLKKKQNENDNDSLLSQILAKNSSCSFSKRNHQSDSSSSTSSSLSSIVSFKKPRVDSLEHLDSNVYKNVIEVSEKLSMHYMSISKIPGIGSTYAQRLTEKNLKTFGDLIDIFEVKCRKNETQFENKLKELASFRGNSAKKITQLIKDYLNKIE